VWSGHTLAIQKSRSRNGRSGASYFLCKALLVYLKMSSPAEKKAKRSTVSDSIRIVEYSGEADDVMDMPRALRWNPGVELRNLDRLLPSGGGAVLLAKDAESTDGESVVGMVCGHRQGDFGWVGLYIVRDPAMRGKGIGMNLWRAMMDGPLKGCTVMGLDGVQEQQHNYKTSGFTFCPHNVVRHFGVLTQQYPSASSVQPRQVSATNSSLLEACVQYDAEQIFPDKSLDRREFIRKWLQMPGSVAFAVCGDDANNNNNKVKGFGLIRPAENDSFRIGPLYADNVEVAQAILEKLGVVSKVNPVCLDVPSTNKTGLDLAKKFGLEPGFTCGRMYAGRLLNENTAKQFGIVCWELTC